ncbi:sulfotransferase [Micromonospora sp. NBC_01655]|uniref:sulfotransferase family protein n=1 Tax=Micromonospora sp. NBC_01655 TaxID=2975983 RepID=UPI002252293E|nr:sulfotransferase [Micromonospora sp. NBC_01655]MCX4472012.1 sulfotransferase [Micromonospora sp. NBC_01655]
MVGTQRSGSNMLRLMLAQLGVFAPPSTHLIADFRPMSVSYLGPGGLGLGRLVEDVLAMVKVNVLAWPDGPPEVGDVLKRCRRADLGEVFRAVYDAGAARCGRTHWVSKDLENMHHADLVQAAATDIRVMHLVRDPRDVALSFASAPIGPKDPRVIGRAWARDQAAAARWRQRAPADHWREVRYEALVADAEGELGRICTFLGLPFREDALAFHRRDDAIGAPRLSALWMNLDSPVLADNVGKYRRPEHREFVSLVEEAAAESLRDHGYSPAQTLTERVYSPEELAAIHARDEALRQLARDRVDPAVEARHRRRDGVLQRLRTQR